MVKKTDDEIRQAMERINWDFDDYSSAKYPLDMNSIPWYPATFPAPIPKYLIALLSEDREIVFDPFGGKGTTAVEALKQRRHFVYNDLNPYAVAIMQCIIDAFEAVDRNAVLQIVEQDKNKLYSNSEGYDSYQGKEKQLILDRLPNDIENMLSRRGIKEDVVYWYHAETLKELIKLHDYIEEYTEFNKGIRKLAFLSILKEVSSQRGHFSYVTDNCRPSEMKYYNAISAYIEMLYRIQRACEDFFRQYIAINKSDDVKLLINRCIIHSGNAKDSSYISDSSVDLIITSPPYLCAQDYILTMRLNDFFYPEEGFDSLPFTEIGPRRLRSRPGIVDSYFDDMELVIKEMNRVLKKDAFFCLVIGQGKGKVSEHVNVIEKVIGQTKMNGFSQLFRTTRKINFRTNRIGGVDKEDIIVFRKK